MALLPRDPSRHVVRTHGFGTSQRQGGALVLSTLAKRSIRSDNPRVTEAEPPDASGSKHISGDAPIRTFLIADVRGYTLFTQERGDEAAERRSVQARLRVWSSAAHASEP